MMKGTTVLDDNTEDVVFKDLESLADFSNSWWQVGREVEPEVSRQLLHDVSVGSETVNAILRHITDDVANAPQGLRPVKGVDKPSQEQYMRASKFLEKPNPDDTCGEWLESLVWDLVLYCDAFLEKVGTHDVVVEENHNYFGGFLREIWHMRSDLMYIIANNRTGQLSRDLNDMSYMQKTDIENVEFSKNKVIRISRFKQGRKYGQSPLLSLLNIIAGQINLTGYMNGLYDGSIAKTLINVGEMGDDDLKRLNSQMQVQLRKAANPYGVMAINVPNGYQVEKLMETAQSSQFLDQLRYYREEICALFSMPPSKMGWPTAGKLGNQGDMDDTYYDNIERIMAKIEKVVNTQILPLLGVTDWYWYFASIRPKRIKIESEAASKNALAGRYARHEHGINVNEYRGIVFPQLKPIDEDWANDYRYVSPVLAAKSGNAGGEEEDDNDEQEQGKTGTTSTEEEHSHKYEVDASGDGGTESVDGHKHTIDEYEVAEVDDHTHTIEDPNEAKFIMLGSIDPHFPYDIHDHELAMKIKKNQ